MMATAYFYGINVINKSENMNRLIPDPASSDDKEKGINTPNGEENSDSDRCISDAEDISKTVEMLLDEEQNKQTDTKSLQGVPVTNKYRVLSVENCNIVVGGTMLNNSLKDGLNKQKTPKLTNKVPTKLICEICGARVSKSTGIKQHLRIHSDIRPYVCGYKTCPCSFKEASTLRRHVKTHSTECLYLCDECGKSFSRSERLKSHKYIHTSNNPNTCSICSKEFSRPDHLKRHLLTHTRLTKFPCSRCDKRFALKYQLTEHMYTHDGIEKPHKCESCEYACVRPSELKHHVDRVHLLKRDMRENLTLKKDIEDTVQCMYCNFTCTTSLELEQHRECVHGLRELNQAKQAHAMDLIRKRIENVVNGDNMYINESNENSPMYLIDNAVYQEPHNEIDHSLFTPEQKSSNPDVETFIPYESEIGNAKSELSNQSINKPMGLEQCEAYNETHIVPQYSLSQNPTFQDQQKIMGQYRYILPKPNFGLENLMSVENRIQQSKESDATEFENENVNMVLSKAFENENENKVSICNNEHGLERSCDISDYMLKLCETDNETRFASQNILSHKPSSQGRQQNVRQYKNILPKSISELAGNLMSVENGLQQTKKGDGTAFENENENTNEHILEKSDSMGNISDSTGRSDLAENRGQNEMDSNAVYVSDMTGSELKIDKENEKSGQPVLTFPNMSSCIISISAKEPEKSENGGAELKSNCHGENKISLNNKISIIIKTASSQISQKSNDLKKAVVPQVSQFLCDVCGKNFSTRESYRNHMRVHKIAMENIQHGCGICYKQFDSKSKLTRHVRTHDPNSVLLCDICGKNFSRADHLKRHKLLHQGQSPHCHSCIICKKQFSRADHLKRHLLRHTRDRK